MGKYMKKSKITGDIAGMEVVSPQSSVGVLTRAAKTLNLKRPQKPSSSTFASSPDASSFSYLQLRSRRLERPSLLKRGIVVTEQPNEFCRQGSKSSSSKPNSSSFKLALLGRGKEENDADEKVFSAAVEVGNDMGSEASFGENNLEVEGRDRNTRESMPSSLIRDSDAVRTPRSTTRQTDYRVTAQRVRIDMQRSIPTSREIEEFFADAEQRQQRLFIEKYNFNVVDDMPLPGRYEWMQIAH